MPLVRQLCCASARAALSRVAATTRVADAPRSRSGDLAALSTLLPLPDAADPFADGFLDVDDVVLPLQPDGADKNTATPAASAEEEARRAARLARNREAAALSRARRRAAADGLEARCSKLETENRELQRTVASLTSENHALRLHILATCPPPAPGSAPAPLAPLPLGVLPVPVLPPSALPLPLPKLPLPKLALPARPAPAPPRKAEPASKPEPASKRKRTTFAAAAAALIALAVIGSPFEAPFDPSSSIPGTARQALPSTAPPPSLQANTSSEALHLAKALLESARIAAMDLNASSTTMAPFLLLSPPSVPLASTEQESSGALVPLFPGTADDDSTALLHTQWLEETWRPLISLPLSDERAKAALKALSVYAIATGSGTTSDLLGMRAPWSALQSTWPTAAPPALTCRRLFEFTPSEDFGTAAPSEAGAADSSTAVPRALRRFGGAWPLPPSASEAAAGPRAEDVDLEVVVSLLQPPAGYTIGETPTVGGSPSASSVLVVVLIRGAQRYLTFSCAL